MSDEDETNEVPLIELARSVPEGLTAEWETQWMEDGTPCGHSMAHVGRFIHQLADDVERLTAGNKRLRRLAVRVYNSGYHEGHNDTVEGCYTDILPVDMDSYHEEIVAEILSEATDND